MKKQMFFTLILLLIYLISLNCNSHQPKKGDLNLRGQDGAYFSQAKPVWLKGREREKNLTVGFRASFEHPKTNDVILKIAASTIYRVYVNGEFLGHGPARAAHGFFRIDEWSMTDRIKNDVNIIAIEVAGYNVNSYYLLDQPAFLQAEVVSAGQVLCSTGNGESGFEATIISERVQKVPRFSFQRPFMECYRLAPESYNWRIDASIQLKKILCPETSPKMLLVRGVTYPEFKKRYPVAIQSQGKITTGNKPERYWKDRSLTRIEDRLRGYKENELEMNPSLTLQETAIVEQHEINSRYIQSSVQRLSRNSFSIYDFGVNLSGFIGGKITCSQKTKLYFVFDEILTENDVNFRRLGCINIVSYDLEPGSYAVESFEPYTLRYLKILVLEGDCSITDIYLREYVNSDISKAHFKCSNEKLNKIFQAGKETFRQNAIDIFMDCPSRERAGWLCDSYFTARVAMDLSGNTRIEKNFYENFLLPEKFEHLPDGMLPMCYPADHDDGTFIPNWALWFVVQLEEYFQRSNDRDMIDALKPKVFALFDYFDGFKNQDGLLEKLESWVFVEWSDANKYVQDVNYPSNMLYSGALSAAGRLYNISEYIEESENIRDMIRKQSFNGTFFVDNAVRNKNGQLEVTNNSSEVCQYYAFFFDIASPETHQDLWQKLVAEFGPDRKTNNGYPGVAMANSFVGNYLRLELLSHYSLTSQLLSESTENFYYMADQTGTLWENIGAYASCNHGFASHIVHVLYRDVLGIYDIDFQKKKIILRFTDMDLPECQGQIPVGNQMINLEWQRDDKALHYKADVPDDYSIEVINLSQLEIIDHSTEVEKFLADDRAGSIKFFGSEVAELFTKEIEQSYRAVLMKNYKTNYNEFMPGYITASIDDRPWHNEMWSRDGGTFLRELVLWGNFNHACVLSDCLIQLVAKNDEGFYTFPEYFRKIEPASGKELDGTAAIVIGMVHLWKRLPNNNFSKNRIYHFLHQEFSPVEYIHQKLQSQPLIEGSGEFGGGCGIEGDWYNVVQNNLVRLALIAAAEMESQVGDIARTATYRRDADKISENMLKYLVAGDGDWYWCINPTTLKPDLGIINHPINKGFGGLNGVASMSADISGLEFLNSGWNGVSACEKTFDKLYSFPLRKEQFDKYGIWSQFDEFREGMSTGPSYGDGYALQTMLLLDRMDMVDKSVAWLANTTYSPLAEYIELDRDSPYYFYERYYSPDIVGKMELEQGCGALNLVNITEPLKVARLILGVDDYSSDEVKIVPRIPPSWSGYEADNWPILYNNQIVRAKIKCEQKNGRMNFNLQLTGDEKIGRLKVRFVTSKGLVWRCWENVSHIHYTSA